ncbi:unnamed protein product, partial [Allacma fusca]
MPKWSELIEFLDERCTILSSSTNDVKETPIKKANDRNKVSVHQTGHDVIKCSWGGSCRKCKQKHSTLLHLDQTPSVASVSAHTATVSNRALMATVKILIQNSGGENQELRALLDPGADVSFISEDATQLLGLKKVRTHTEISGVGGSQAGTAKYIVQFELRSKLEEIFSMQVNAYVLPKITCLLPKNEVKFSEFDHLKHVTLADPSFFTPGCIDVLLGADVFYDVLRDGRLTGKEG